MRILLIGFGAVGRSFAEILVQDGRRLAKEHGLRPKVVGIADSKGAAVAHGGVDLQEAIQSKTGTGSLSALGAYEEGASALDLVKDVDCEVVIETTPTELTKGEPGLSHVRTALMQKRHVVCTNKGPLAIAMPALIELAHHNRVIFKFSGTVGGGTPVLDFAKRCLEGSTMRSLRGILNGTSNYILTRMASEGISMRDALDEARRLGYAEADPTYDIGGFDTACKLVITSNYVLGTNMSINDVDIGGIEGVTVERVEKAKAAGSVVKLIGSVAKTAKVALEEVPATHPLNVSGTFNAITFDTDNSGEITLVGKGAGGRETASSIVRDLMEIRRAYAR